MSRLFKKFGEKIKEFQKLEKQEMTESRIICKDSMKINFDDKNRLRLFYKEKELTKFIGFSMGILCDAVWHYSVNSGVAVKKISQDEMQITLTFNELPLNQIWKIKITPEGNISLNIDIQLKECLRIDRMNAALFLSKVYKNWFVPPVDGQFPSDFNDRWQTMNPARDNNPEFIGVYSSSDDIPGIILKHHGEKKGFLTIQNSDINLSSRILEVQFEEDKELYQVGIYPYLRATIQIYPDRSIFETMLNAIKKEKRRQEEEKRRQEEEKRRQEEEKKKQEEEERLRKLQDEEQRKRTLQKGFFRLYFDPQNRTHIYYKGNELTNNFGINTVILSEGKWFSSFNSRIEVEKQSSDEIIISFSHHNLPLIQIWRLGWNVAGILNWHIDIQLKECLRIDRMNAALFLSKVYKNWFVPPVDGQFPSDFNDRWQTMNPARDNNPEFIGVYSSSDDIPGIILKHHGEKKGFLTIQNSDINLSSRILEVQFEEDKELYQVGIYPYLRATIQIYPDKSVVEDIIKKIQEQERKKQETQRKFEEELRKKKESEKTYIELKEKSGLGALEYNDRYNICIYGDSAELHDKISLQSGNFQITISKIKNAQKNSIGIKIGVSKFNFFRLDKIAQFCSALTGKRCELRSISLKLFPLKDIYSNFIEYIKELKMRIDPYNIDFFLQDDKFPELLKSVSSQADQYNEKDLLRLLGIISEYPFIGPQTIVLDTFHRCNTNCIHCWIHSAGLKQSSVNINLKMDISLFKKVIDDASKLLTDEIIIQGDGEPLLDIRFMDMINYARNKGLKVLFFTNGILLDQKKSKELIELEIDEIFCSLPAGTDNTYSIINSRQSKKTFSRVVNNLHNLVLLKNKLQKNKPWIQMNHVIHNLNYHELDEMAKTDSFIGADKTRFYLVRLDENIKSLKLSPNHIEAIKKSLESVGPYLKQNNIELQDNIYFQLENYNPTTGYWSNNSLLHSSCPVGWFFSLILAKGEISMCCHLRVVGYLKEKSFKEIWESEQYNNFRIQAKYLMENKNVTFLNGIKLYDEFCNHCDTHQVILRINALLRKYNLSMFL